MTIGRYHHRHYIQYTTIVIRILPGSSSPSLSDKPIEHYCIAVLRAFHLFQMCCFVVREDDDVGSYYKVEGLKTQLVSRLYENICLPFFVLMQQYYKYMKYFPFTGKFSPFYNCLSSFSVCSHHLLLLTRSFTSSIGSGVYAFKGIKLSKKQNMHTTVLALHTFSLPISYKSKSKIRLAYLKRVRQPEMLSIFFKEEQLCNLFDHLFLQLPNINRHTCSIG